MTRVEAPGAELDGALPDGTGSPAGEGSLDVTGSPGGAGTPGGAAPQRGAGTLGLSPPAAVGLPERLTAVARLVQIGSARSGSDGFSPELLHDAEELVARAGQRLRLSSEHTIVVLAGGTGSGKSSLFNRLAGADFSAAGTVRPVTREPHACVWGMAGAGPLLDWLGVQARHRYARSSELDDGERSLAGLLLLDLPDHDSVLAGRSVEVNRLVGLADLMVWVLDPQKYADAAVHSRYLVPMAGHSSVIAVVLNQADMLTPAQAEDCEADLRRLLDTEGLHDTPIVVTSAVSGAGMADLRRILLETVLARQASVRRLAADITAVAGRFARYAGGDGAAPAADGAAPAADGVPAVTAGGVAELAGAFARAAGVTAIGQAVQSARELRSVDHVGWPIAWLADRAVRRDPVRKVRLGTLWAELRDVSAGPRGASQADIDQAITAFADEAGRGLPDPWQAGVRTAARARAGDVPGALGAAVAGALPAENSVLPWWRLAAVWQGLLLGCAVVGVGWLAALLALGTFGAGPHAPVPLRDTAYLPWVALLLAAVLLAGWLSAKGCLRLVERAAQRERQQVEQRMRERITQVAHDLVAAPAEQELAEFRRFREELNIASRGA